MARAIDQNHAMRRRKLLAERKPHIFHISARAMDQNDGGFGAGAATRKAQLSHMQPHALDHNELAGWRMRRLNPRNAERSRSHKYAKHQGKCDYGSREGHTFPGRSQREAVCCMIRYSSDADRVVV